MEEDKEIDPSKYVMTEVRKARSGNVDVYMTDCPLCKGDITIIKPEGRRKCPRCGKKFWIGRVN